MPAEGAVFALAAAVVAGSAVLTKEATREPSVMPALAATASPDGRAVLRPASAFAPEPIAAPAPEPAPVEPVAADATVAEAPGGALDAGEPPITRWFDGRPIRPVGTRTMRVTAYSPDERSCGAFADGQTATLHSVWTNGMRLVAADTDVLPFGTLLTVPGYAGDSVVPVLDRGGAIKGRRLDVLMASHELARAWGVRELEVTVWSYADGLPPTDPRRAR